MTNTIENKQRFFDAYSGQKIFRYSWNEELYTNRYLDQEKLHKYTAELKLLSEITKEESDYISRLKVICHSDGTHDLEPMQHTTDYLRSRGYLLPFMDLTIEKILEYGWAVLKSK